MLEILFYPTPRQVSQSRNLLFWPFLVSCGLRSSFRQESQNISQKLKDAYENSGEGRLRLGIYSRNTLCHTLSSKDTGESIVWLIGNLCISTQWARVPSQWASLTVLRISTGTKGITGVSRSFKPGWDVLLCGRRVLARARHRLQNMFEPRIRMAIVGIRENAKHRLGYCFSQLLNSQ